MLNAAIAIHRAEWIEDDQLWKVDLTATQGEGSFRECRLFTQEEYDRVKCAGKYYTEYE